jgi:hypothetical protein
VSRLGIQNLDRPISFVTEAFPNPSSAIPKRMEPIQNSEWSIPAAVHGLAAGLEWAE